MLKMVKIKIMINNLDSLMDKEKDLNVNTSLNKDLSAVEQTKSNV